jgi:hypothetical protein
MDAKWRFSADSEWRFPPDANTAFQIDVLQIELKFSSQIAAGKKRSNKSLLKVFHPTEKIAHR